LVIANHTQEVPAPNPLTDNWVIAGVDAQLAAKGWKEVENDPDAVVISKGSDKDVQEFPPGPRARRNANNFGPSSYGANLRNDFSRNRTLTGHWPITRNLKRRSEMRNRKSLALLVTMAFVITLAAAVSAAAQGVTQAHQVPVAEGQKFKAQGVVSVRTGDSFKVRDPGGAETSVVMTSSPRSPRTA
jgi:hypothetical protein